MNKSITPTVARSLHFVLVNTWAGFAGNPGDNFAAILAHVNNERSINVAVSDAAGRWHAFENVPLVQDGESEPAGNFCRWMPFQVGQAQKSEVDLSALADRLAALEQTVAALTTPRQDAPPAPVPTFAGGPGEPDSALSASDTPTTEPNA
jgi:hypothetical protein